jgi:hypothetical protein
VGVGIGGFFMHEFPKLNLKQKVGEIIYFRRVPSDVIKIIQRTRRNESGEEVVQNYKLTKEAYVYFKEEHVINFSLDRTGQSLPDFDTDYTKIKNYFLYFWTYFIGMQAGYLYITLLSYCYGKERDYCWPSLSSLCEMLKTSRPSLLKYLKILEDYGFIFRFWTLNSTNESREETPLIKVRKQIPYLPADLVKKLPENLQKKHDEFIQKYLKKYNVELVPYSLPNYEEIYSDFIYTKGEIHEDAVKKQLDLHKRRQLLKEKIDEKSHKIWGEVQLFLQERLSKPSYEVYFAHTLCELYKNSIILYVSNHFVKDRIEEVHGDLIISAFKELGYDDYKEIIVKLYE